MLRFVSLVGELRRIEARLPKAWRQAHLKLVVSDPNRLDRAAALLGPATPARHGSELFITAARDGSGPGLEHVRRLLRKLDAERVPAAIELVDAVEATPNEEPGDESTLVQAWHAAVAKLPSDWTDLWAEVELESSDYLERAALAMSPLNPSSFGDRLGLRFRSARRFGYGAAPEMVHTCLGRCDNAGVRGAVRILRALSDTVPVGTQGPVWYVGGRVV
jgi:hypothetical protein